ncbi:hypothetical protein SAMN05444344_1524 [Tenacibaculum mesophilum]|uniref:Uncharacterized protein n=1 Tax=Tenacibaculum mesophilum TaxID=104268 RepID=A0ABM7CG45_9FLAO|nr:hypothetical protein [Tenacibaculum mesophilum]AZJ32740.1 hypothetical protein D6200_09295 [Tenacibaculum mesophilum]QFS27990.1 hypothetical protein F9Y86_06130 [Tenacibaculum mesophilum]BFF36412.1 hypothetical protein BACT7_12740 [Tenacibaculum mesophilum]SHF75304.1 hypothetical protein SAMN05444344_1524 [Tenacibaculum mesophilum]
MKLTINLLLIFVFSITSYSQVKDKPKEITLVSEEVFGFVTKLRDQINIFFESEKKDRLKRNLKYFRNDLKEYLRLRGELLSFITEEKFNKDSKEIKEKSKKVKSALDDLTEMLVDLTNMVSDELSVNSEVVLNNISLPLRSNARTWKDVDLLLDGYDIDTGELTQRGDKIRIELEKTLKLILEIRNELD